MPSVTSYKLLSQLRARADHQWVAVSAAFQDAGFDAAGTIRHLVGGDARQGRTGHLPCVAARPGGQQHPGRKDCLAGEREADLSRLLVVHRRGRGDDLACQVVGQQRHPQFPLDHLRRLATRVIQAECLLDVPNVQFCVPTVAVQFGNVLFGVGGRIGQRRDDRDRLDPAAWNCYIEL